MIRYLRIFLHYFQYVFENRSRSFVWFLISLVNPLILLVYWLGYYRSQGIANMTVISSVTTYYFLLVIAGSLLMSHIEEDIAYEDIQLGDLSIYLLQPFSYLLAKMFGEFPWRVIQGFFGAIILIFSMIFFGSLISLNITWQSLFFGLITAFLAFILSFYFKVVIGLSAFWLIEFSGFSQFVGVLILIFAGYIMPIDLYPNLIKTIAFATPFPYMIYFPVVVFQGKLTLFESLKTILIQLIWILVFMIVYKTLFNKGVKKFTGLGN